MTDRARAAKRIVDIFNTGNIDAVASAVAEDYVDHQGLGDAEIRGREGFVEVVKAVRKYADVRVTIEDIVTAGDKVAVRLRWHGVNDARRTVTRETLDLLRFSDDRLVEHWGAQIYRRER